MKPVKLLLEDERGILYTIDDNVAEYDLHDTEVALQVIREVRDAIRELQEEKQDE